MQEDLKLTEVVEVIWKGKVIIISLTVIAMLLSGIYSFFILSPVYEVTASMVVNVSSDKSQTASKDFTPFAEQVKSDFIIRGIMDEMKKNSDKLFGGIGNSVTIETAKDSKLIRIRVKGTDSDLITQLANVAAYKMGALIDISSNLEMNATYKRRLVEVEDEIKLSESEFTQASKQIETLPEKLITQKSLDNEPYLQSVVGDVNNGVSNKKLGSLQFTSEEINPVYIDLKTKISDASIKLSRLKSEKKNLEGRILANNESVDNYQQNSGNIDTSGKGLIQAQSQLNSMLITPAIKPEFSIGPNKKLNIAIGGLIGFIISLCVVFGRKWFVENVRHSETSVELSS